MKKFALFLFALLMISFSVLAQIKLVVCQEGGIRSEFIASNVDSIIFVGLEDTPDVPVKPDDGDDDIDTPEVELPGEGKIRFLIDATAVDACYGIGIEGGFNAWNAFEPLQGTEFAENMFYIDMPSMTAAEFNNAKILLLDEDGTSSWDYQVSDNGYDITGSEDYITLIDDYGTQNAINLVADNIDNVVIKIAILEVESNPCNPVLAGYAKFVLTVKGDIPDGKKVIFTGNYGADNDEWGASTREMTKQADGTYVWEGAYPENFQFKAFIADCEDLGFGEDDYGYIYSELWLEGSNIFVTADAGSVIEFEGCFQFLCPEDDDIVDPDKPINPDDDEIINPEVELPGEGKIRFIVDATAVDACYGVGFVGGFNGWNVLEPFKGTEFAKNMFYIDIPSMTAEEFGTARILLLDKDGTSFWDYQVSDNAYDITGSEDYITIIDDYGTQDAIFLVDDNIDNVIIKVAILEVDDTPCKPDVPAGYAKFVLTVKGDIPDGKKVIFTGNFGADNDEWGESTREMTKQADGTYVWEGAYPENFQFKAFIADCEDLGLGEDGYILSELWLVGANRLVEFGSGSVIEFEGCFQYLCPEDDDIVVPETSGFVAKPFSVSATKTVTFSPGNLQYYAANNKWRFAPNQTDYIGEANDNISSTYNGWIDLFGWGTGNNPTNKSTDYSDYSTFVDWGVNKISNYAPNTWRTLTYDEWYYLRNERPNHDKLIGVAQVNGVHGLILLPDAWVCPSGVTFKAGFLNDWCQECYDNYQTISALEWSKLEASGAVFFPAAGYRYGSGVDFVQGGGRYWSATETNYDDADILSFDSDEAYMGNGSRYYGLSVRLVQD